MPKPPVETRERIWVVPASPVIWGAHFLATYATASVWCGRWAGPTRTLDVAGLVIAGYTVVALAAIMSLGLYGWRAHRLNSADVPHDDDTPEDRHRFLGLATLLLSGLSGVGVIYSALAVWVGGSCL
jgi:hypothetical protein